MVGLVIVSHSWKIAEGVKDLASQMAPGFDGIRAAGGLEDGEIGTDATRIMEAIQAVDQGDGVVILCDLGSAIMSAETAIELLEDEEGKYRIADAPVVEGAIVAAVEAAGGEDLESIIASAEDARNESKL
ncbi:MAG: PTS-dependent dihydroxyacetone kinase phosphotransferase subunit DhaM [Lachnospiraceae bacterium]|nr:PTS-dependent dihydroxyacetone kinase phosphotransferase subunit DhaM [Lachnospiraceae bacterium]